MTRMLPAALAGWAPALAGIDPELATALGPLVRRLDELVRSTDDADDRHGIPEGYGGVTSRGDPRHLLLSEWALAMEVPQEFTRRAAAGELLYLERSHHRPRRRGRVTVLVDSGPDQLGAGRLVQLAALVVLRRRAAERGAELQLGVLGDEPGRWRVGDRLLGDWLRSRRPLLAQAADVADWTATLDRADEAWLLTGPELAATLPGRRRTVVAAEAAWSAAGATAVAVSVDGRATRLPLPAGPAAVRALRTASIGRPQRVRGPDGLRAPVFSSADPVLLARTDRDDEIVRIAVADVGERPSPPRRYTFTGPVLTAAVIGGRLVAIVAVGGDLHVEVRGKRLGSVAQVTASAMELSMSRSDLAAIPTGPLTPLVFLAGGLLARLAGRWWRLSADLPPQPEDVVALLPGPVTDRPLVAVRRGPWVMLTPRGRVAVDAAELILGPQRGFVAWPVEPGRWRVTPDGVTIAVEPGESVLALHRIAGVPTLVTASAAGVLVRLRTPTGVRTLTRWSGGALPPTVHPTRPWVALGGKGGRLVVGDLATGVDLPAGRT